MGPESLGKVACSLLAVAFQRDRSIACAFHNSLLELFINHFWKKSLLIIDCFDCEVVLAVG